MTNLLNQIKRIFQSTKSIFEKIFSVTTTKTSSVFKTIGSTAAIFIAVIAVISIVIVILIVSIPVGAVVGNSEPTESSVQPQQENENVIPIS